MRPGQIVGSIRIDAKALPDGTVLVNVDEAILEHVNTGIHIHRRSPAR